MYLDLVMDVREDDIVYCFFYLKDFFKYVILSVLYNLLLVEKNYLFCDVLGRKFKDFLIIIIGMVCFFEWM